MATQLTVFASYFDILEANFLPGRIEVGLENASFMTMQALRLEQGGQCCNVSVI